MANLSFFLLLLVAIFLIFSDCMEAVYGADTSGGGVASGLTDKTSGVLGGTR
uniref:Uncharacterized protein n=1 Tax=Anopheles arabiensis TaxID=7173 RepID=A0A182II91_ANOAR